MNADITLLALITLTTLFFVLRRTHVALTTMALSAGYVLSDRATYAISQTAWGYLGDTDIPVYSIVKLTLLFAPAVFMAFHFRNTQKGSGRFIEQLVPAFSLSLLLIIFVLEQLTLETREEYLDMSVALNQLWVYSHWVVVFALGSAFFDMLLHKPHENRGKAGKKKGRKKK